MLLIILMGSIIHPTLATNDQCLQNYCINNLLEKLAPLYTKVEKKCRALDKQDDVLLKMLKTLNQTVEELTESNKRQQEINNLLKEENEQLKIALQNQTMNVKDVRKEVVLLKNKTRIIDEIERTVLSLLDAELGTAQSKRFGFFAKLTNTISYTSAMIVVYNNAVTNVGDAYNASTGIFTAPVEGIYLFSATLLTYNRYTQLHICKNSNIVGMAYADGSRGGAAHDHSTHTVIVDLQKEDEVYITLGNSGGAGSYVMYGGDYSSFLGVLVQ